MRSPVNLPARLTAALTFLPLLGGGCADASVPTAPGASRRRPAGILVATSLFLLLVGCDSGDPAAPDAAVVSIIVTAPKNDLLGGETLQLAVVVQAGAGVSTAATWSSGNTSVATVDANGLVTGLTDGVVEITATSVADPSKSDGVLLNVRECGDPVVVDAAIGNDTTWPDVYPALTCVDYLVTVMQVLTYRLTLEPGVVVAFGQDRGLELKGDGSLSAVGTEDLPIRLTGEQEVRGAWRGLAFNDSDHAENRLEWVTIEYGGGQQYWDVPANLTVLDGFVRSQVAVVNSTIRESAGYGVVMVRASRLTSFDGNVVTANAAGPAWVYATNLHDLHGSQLLGNDIDEVVVTPNAITSPSIWRANGLPYRILQVLNRAALTIRANLVIEPGVVLEFEEDMAMHVAADGSLVAVGTGEAPIVLTGTQPVPGHWRGLSFQFAVANQLENVVVEYGGRRETLDDLTANVAVHTAGTSVSIRNSIFSDSEGYGLQIDHGALVSFGSSILTRNARGAAYVTVTSAHQLEATSSYTGNLVDVVTVKEVSAPIEDGVTWSRLGVPYHIITSLNEAGFSVQGSLTLDPGVEIMFDPGMGLAVRGSLSALGSPDDHIILRAAGGGPWRGISVHDASAVFEFIDISDAGSDSWGQVDEPAVISISTAGASSSAEFRSMVSAEGPANTLAFSHGNAIAKSCFGDVYYPWPDEWEDHCK